MVDSVEYVGLTKLKESLPSTASPLWSDRLSRTGRMLRVHQPIDSSPQIKGGPEPQAELRISDQDWTDSKMPFCPSKLRIDGYTRHNVSVTRTLNVFHTHTRRIRDRPPFSMSVAPAMMKLATALVCVENVLVCNLPAAHAK